MSIRKYHPENNHQLITLWKRSVVASHHFLTTQDIEVIAKQMEKQYLANTNIWVFLNDHRQITGFIGLNDDKIEMIFVDPDHQKQRVATRLLDFIRCTIPVPFIDVNEQNELAYHFYLHYGFEKIGYSALDAQGNPFPIIHMKYNKKIKRVKR